MKRKPKQLILARNGEHIAWAKSPEQMCKAIAQEVLSNAHFILAGWTTVTAVRLSQYSVEKR